jgi:hypothetical protein
MEGRLRLVLLQMDFDVIKAINTGTPSQEALRGSALETYFTNDSVNLGDTVPARCRACY